MESLPLHPAFAHVPLGITIVLPIITIAYLILFSKKILNSKSFLLILLMHGILAISINVTSARGEEDSKKVRKYLDKSKMSKIKDHEENAEALMFFAYFALISMARMKSGCI